MADLQLHVDRNPSLQPSWAKNFLDAHQLNYGLIDPREWSLKNLPVVIEKRADLLNVLVEKTVSEEGQFDPVVQLVFSEEDCWVFSWPTEEDKTMFLLKWG